MNDSMEILRRGFSCINQFPWLYVAVVKPFALISRYLFHSYEPAIFCCHLFKWESWRMDWRIVPVLLERR